jgi:hypothetical protein
MINLKKTINKFCWQIFLLIIVELFFIPITHAFIKKVSAKDACHLLLKIAMTKHLSAEESARGYYDCVPDSGANKYFILGLHYRLRTDEN